MNCNFDTTSKGDFPDVFLSDNLIPIVEIVAQVFINLYKLFSKHFFDVWNISLDRLSNFIVSNSFLHESQGVSAGIAAATAISDGLHLGGKTNETEKLCVKTK